MLVCVEETGVGACGVCAEVAVEVLALPAYGIRAEELFTTTWKWGKSSEV